MKHVPLILLMIIPPVLSLNYNNLVVIWKLHMGVSNVRAPGSTRQVEMSNCCFV